MKNIVLSEREAYLTEDNNPQNRKSFEFTSNSSHLLSHLPEVKST